MSWQEPLTRRSSRKPSQPATCVPVPLLLRLAPLSEGRMEGDNLMCSYHGDAREGPQIHTLLHIACASAYVHVCSITVGGVALFPLTGLKPIRDIVRSCSNQLSNEYRKAWHSILLML
eukprot:1157802-Pelagomonas_calceolata.AAC.2